MHVLLFLIKGHKLVGPIKAITMAIRYRIAMINLWINRQAGKMDGGIRLVFIHIYLW